MKYTSSDMQIILIHPVVSAGQGGSKVVDHPVLYLNLKAGFSFKVLCVGNTYNY